MRKSLTRILRQLAWIGFACAGWTQPARAQDLPLFDPAEALAYFNFDLECFKAELIERPAGENAAQTAAETAANAVAKSAPCDSTIADEGTEGAGEITSHVERLVNAPYPGAVQRCLDLVFASEQFRLDLGHLTIENIAQRVLDRADRSTGIGTELGLGPSLGLDLSLGQGDQFSFEYTRPAPEPSEFDDLDEPLQPWLSIWQPSSAWYERIVDFQGGLERVFQAARRLSAEQARELVSWLDGLTQPAPETDAPWHGESLQPLFVIHQLEGKELLLPASQARQWHLVPELPRRVEEAALARVSSDSDRTGSEVESDPAGDDPTPSAAISLTDVTDQVVTFASDQLEAAAWQLQRLARNLRASQAGPRQVANRSEAEGRH